MRLGHLLAICSMLLLIGCEVDRGFVVPPDPGAPLEVRPDIFRLTFHRQPDLVPHWLDSVTVGYRSRNFALFEAPLDTGALLLARSIRGGPSQERGRRLREQGTPLNLLAMSAPVTGSAQFIAFWQRAPNDVAVCRLPCPGVAARGASVVRTDGAATDSLLLLPRWDLQFDRIRDSVGLTDRFVDVRFLPADADALTRGTNPFGPAVSGASPAFVLSDGAAIYRGSGVPGDPMLDSVTAGAYPALSPDGRLLAFTRIALSDSTTETCTVFAGLGSCIQTTTTVLEASREIWLHTLATGDEQMLLAGAEQAAFDADGSRVVVVTAAGLAWVDVASGGTTPIPNTAGAHSPAVSPDGRYVAFVAEWSGQPDVYFARVATP